MTRLAPFRAEDLTRFRLPGLVDLSPDRSRVAFEVASIDVEANQNHQSIWLCELKSATLRPFTAGSKREGLPRWSPDGRWLGFLSDRETKKAQVFVMPADGGEPRRLTNFRWGASEYAWSPDGRQIVCVARTVEGEDLEGDPPDDPPAFWLITRIRSKADGNGLLAGRTHLFLVSIDGGSVRPLTSGDWDDVQPAWSPDGQWIAFISDRHRDRDLEHRPDLWLVSARGARPRRLTSGKGCFSSPAWSPDGMSLAYLGHEKGNSLSANQRLWVLNPIEGEPRCLTTNWDRSVSNDILSDLRDSSPPVVPVWSSDGRQIYVLANEAGNASMFRVSARGSEPACVVRGRRQVLAYAVIGDEVVFTASDPLQPGELYRLGSNGAEHRLSEFNDEITSGLALSDPEELWFDGANGDRLHGWVMRPPAIRRRGRLPALLQVHGGPHALYGNVFSYEFQLLAARGYAVVCSNPHGSRGYGEAFADSIRGAWGDLDYRDVMAAVDHVAGSGLAHPNRLGVIGGSYGGYLTNWIVGHTDRFSAAVTDRSVVNLETMWATSDIGVRFCEWEFLGLPTAETERYRDLSPLSYAKHVRTPVLIIHGEQDLRCPIEQAEQWFISLKRAGRTAELLRFPEESHNLSRSGRPDRRVERLRRIADWFDRFLCPT